MAEGTLTPGSPTHDQYEQHLVSGGELLRQDRVNDAVHEFNAALALQPEDGKALGLLGLAYFRMSAFAEALPVYEKLVTFHGNDPSLRLNLGLVHLKLGNAERAIEELQRSRDLDPSQGRAVSYLGLAYARSGDYANAYQAFLQAGQTDLAREMEQYLTDEQRDEIAASVKTPPAPRASDAYEIVQVEDVVDAPVIVPRPAEPEPGADADGGVVGAPVEERSVVSIAVHSAAPSAAAQAGAARVVAGHQPPQPLSEFATARLIRPSDGDQPFEIGAAGALVIRVRGKVMSRTEGVVVSGGELGYEQATRRVRGKSSDEPFGAEGRPLFIVTGEGHMVASPLGEHFASVILDEDILYLRENLVFAFEDKLRWEAGHVPGSAGAIHMVQFRGEGCVSFRSKKPLVSVKLSPGTVLYVDADALAGWIGRVVPRIVAPAAGGTQSTPFVECSGEGVILVEELDDTSAADNR